LWSYPQLSSAKGKRVLDGNYGENDGVGISVAERWLDNVANIERFSDRCSFSQAALTVWNNLPLDSRSAKTHALFRPATKKHNLPTGFLQTDHVTVSTPMIRFSHELWSIIKCI